MDAHRFDALTRALSSRSRRGLLGLLLTLPVLGGLLAFVASDETEAKGRRRRRKKRHKHGKGHGRHRKGKRKQRCRKKSRARICRGKCGIVKNRKTCKKRVNCGACGAGQLCIDGACQPCDVCASGCPFTSLQDAIDAANPGDTIRLCAETYPGTFTIAKNLTLVGAGEDGTILDGQRQGTVVTVGDRTVALQGLRIINGANTDRGGGIHGVGRLTLTDCTVADNTAGDDGGGLYNAGGEMVLSGSTVSGNTAISEQEGFGGGIANFFGVLTLVDSTVTNNTAGLDGGGIFLAGNGPISLEGDSHVCENTAGGEPSNCSGFNDPACMETCPA